MIAAGRRNVIPLWQHLRHPTTEESWSAVMTTPEPYISNSLTRELGNRHSPVRQFLDEQFRSGLRDVQRRYREPAPDLVVAPVPQGEANPGTLGTAADWLLRFLLHPRPDVHLAMTAAAYYIGPKMMRALADMTTMLGAPPRPYTGPVATGPEPVNHLAGVEDLIAPVGASPGEPAVFTGPVPGSTADPELLSRSCWALALLTEGFRAGPQALARGPLGAYYRPDAGSSLNQPDVTADGLLALAPPAALDQLAQFRRVFETALIPQLAGRRGPWALGPSFAGSTLFTGADADLIAASLLLDLKTPRKLSLEITDLFQVIAYALLDFDDEYRLDTVGLFSARYAYLSTWPLGALLGELAGHEIGLHATRAEFHQLLAAHQDPKLAAVADQITRSRSGR